MPSGVVEAVHPAPAGPPATESIETPNEEKKETEEKETSKGVKTEEKESASAQSGEAGEQGVEVVLGDRGTSKVVEESQKTQNVFRHPQAVRPRAMRAPGGPPPHQPYLHGSGSWGYPPPYPPPHHHGDYAPHGRPYPVPPYGSSASFEDQGYHHTPHYSPHVQYPPPGGRYSEDVNVISPNHKSDPQHYRNSLTPRPRAMHPPHGSSGPGYYQYPPTSPVSRPGGPSPTGPPRVRSYAMNRSAGAAASGAAPDGPYSKAQRGDRHPEDGTWNAYPSPPRSSPSGDMSRRQPPLVTESSFDSEHRSMRSHPPTPSGPAMPPPNDPHQFYGGGSWGSFDSAAGPPPHFEDYRYYNAPPESPYSSYMPPYSPSGSGIYPADSFPPPAYYGQAGSFSYSYDEEDRFLKDYHPDGDHHHSHHSPKQVTPNDKGKGGRGRNGTPVSSNTSNNMLLPKAAEEVDFDVTDPPLEPVLPPSEESIVESLADVNNYDVLCGRGGGTNSQIGNRRFRKLVQDFQPTYLLARRKEKPLLARTIVLIIRKRGGRFLKKDEDSGALFEVGDAKAEAKTSQALREGLDVRATKSAASSLLEKKKKKKNGDKSDVEDTPSPGGASVGSRGRKSSRSPGSPPVMPRLHAGEHPGRKLGPPHHPHHMHHHPHGPMPPHSPMGPDQSHMHVRKRRRMPGGGFTADRFFPDFCPPRADLGRPTSPMPNEGSGPNAMNLSTTPIRRNTSRDDDDIRDFDDAVNPGCTGIALDMVTGAATGSFCLGPSGWRR